MPPYVKVDWKTGTDNPEYGVGVALGAGEGVGAFVGVAVGCDVGEPEGVGDGVACVDTWLAMRPRDGDPKPVTATGFASGLDTCVPDVRMTETRCLRSVRRMNPKRVVSTIVPLTTTREGGTADIATYAAYRWTATT